MTVSVTVTVTVTVAVTVTVPVTVTVAVTVTVQAWINQELDFYNRICYNGIASASKQQNKKET